MPGGKRKAKGKRAANEEVQTGISTNEAPVAAAASGSSVPVNLTEGLDVVVQKLSQTTINADITEDRAGPSPVVDSDGQENTNPGTAFKRKRRRRGKRGGGGGGGGGVGGDGGNGATQADPTGGPSTCPSTQPPEPAVDRTEYHHFIPRLVLREFATAESRAQEGRNPSIRVYSLRDVTITPTPVARCYGHYNMYQDASAADKMHIERALSTLEGQAARLIVRIKRAQEMNERSVTLTRVERNTIRKFLFVMKYRSPLFWAKYACSLEEYGHVDREEVLRYMEKRGFTKPIEIWLHTLKTILDTHIDAKNEWIRTLMATCFVPDVGWFWLNMTGFFMAFCQPRNLNDEFILSESAFGIHEGPTETRGPIPLDAEAATTALSNNPGPGGAELSSEREKFARNKGWYTEFHKMAPFSPRLLLVLRSNHLRNEETKQERHRMADEGIWPGSHQWKMPSVFEHLHLDPPDPTYVVGPEPDNHTDNDVFKFTLHRLSHRDLSLFNFIILNEVRLFLTWNSNDAMKRTLREYLADEKFCLSGEIVLDKNIERNPELLRRQKLQSLVALLDGYQGPPSEIPLPSLTTHFQGMSQVEENLRKSPLARGYFILGKYLRLEFRLLLYSYACIF